MTKIKIVTGSAKLPIFIGSFNSVTKNGETDIYYNVNVGQYSNEMYSMETEQYENLKNLHWSLHNSGKVHLKQGKGIKKIITGQMSDRSSLISKDSNIAIVGLESFYLDRAPYSEIPAEYLELFPPPKICQYSILWLFVPENYPKTITPRLLWVNLWERKQPFSTVRTASISDMLIRPEMFTVLTINNWSIRGCFLNVLLPTEDNGSDDIKLIHPRGEELPWRMFSFINLHLPLGRMMMAKAIMKTPIFASQQQLILPSTVINKSLTPYAWVKTR